MGVVGATGNVGTVMLSVLAERGIPIRQLRAFASERSAGSTVRSGKFEAVVEDLATADPSGLDVALFSAGAERAREHAQRFVDAGCIVIDNSSAFRMDSAVPLIVPEVNAHALRTHRGIIANPNWHQLTGKGVVGIRTREGSVHLFDLGHSFALRSSFYKVDTSLDFFFLIIRSKYGY